MHTSISDIYSIFRKYPQISTDSRNITVQSIFFALRGDNFDANKFAGEAIRNGAVYAIIDDATCGVNDKTILVEDTLVALQELARYHRRQLKIPVLGITGSNGKTTTKELIGAVLSQKFKTFSTFGNLNNHIGVPLSVLSIADDVDIAVIEMGANHQGEIANLCQICQPDLGIITNIGKAHLGGFGGFNGVIKAKTELYDFIRNNGGKLFVNGDDELLMSKSEGIPRVVYGNVLHSKVRGRISQKHPFLELDIDISTQIKHVNSKLIGSYNFTNMLAAACIGNYFEVDADKIAEGLSAYNPVNNRSQWHDSGKNKIVMDAYNANPSSMELAITNFSEAPYKNKLVILGDMRELGKEAVAEHQTIVELILKSDFEQIILVGEVFSALEIDPKIESFKTVDEAKRAIKNLNLSGKTILLKGSRGIQLEKLMEVL